MLLMVTKGTPRDGNQVRQPRASLLKALQALIIDGSDDQQMDVDQEVLASESFHCPSLLELKCMAAAAVAGKVQVSKIEATAARVIADRKASSAARAGTRATSGFAVRSGLRTGQGAAWVCASHRYGAAQAASAARAFPRP